MVNIMTTIFTTTLTSTTKSHPFYSMNANTCINQSKKQSTVIGGVIG